MSTVTIKAHIHMRLDWQDKPAFELYSSDMSHIEGFGVKVGEHAFDFELPDGFNPIAEEVKGLEKKMAELRRKFQEDMEGLSERISKLQAIEYTPEAVA